MGCRKEHCPGRSKLEYLLSGRVCRGLILPRGNAPPASSPHVPSSPAALRFCTVNAVDTAVWPWAAVITPRETSSALWPAGAQPALGRGSPHSRLHSDVLSPPAQLGNWKFPQIVHSRGSAMRLEDEHSGLGWGRYGAGFTRRGGMLPARGALSPYVCSVAGDKWPHNEPLASTGRFGGLGEPQTCILQQNCPGSCPCVAETRRGSSPEAALAWGG